MLVKYWLSVSDEEQERRFEKRLSDPRKRWKFSPIDLQARARWVDYAEAKDRMFARTDTEQSPWYVVEADDKRTARLNLISHLLSLVPYEHLPGARGGRSSAAPAAQVQAPAEATERMVPERSTGVSGSGIDGARGADENRPHAGRDPDPDPVGDQRRVAGARARPRRARAARHRADRHGPDEPEPPRPLPTGGGGEESVVVKLASEDPTSRATGVGMGAYYREIAFYRDLAPRIGGPLPHCHLAEYDAAEGWFTIVLEDIADARQGDQIAGCRVAAGARSRCRAGPRARAGDRRDALGARRFLNQPNPLDQALLTQLLPGFLERYGERI